MNEDVLNLLTAAVDGELSPAEQWRVNELLVESVEARSVLARLQSDSIRVKNLARVSPPAKLAQSILVRLSAIEPIRPRGRTYSRQLFALAASLLLVVGLGSFLLYTQANNAKPGNATTAQNPTNYNEVLPRESGPLSVPDVAPPPSPGNNIAQNSVPSVESPVRIDEIPPPRAKGADVLVAPPLVPIGPLERLIVRVPVLVSTTDLERDDVRQKLLDELGREPAYRIDLFTKDASRGAELFQTAAKNAGLNLSTDTLTQERIKKKQASSYVVYVESLTAAEIRDLLVRLSADDAKSPQRVFDSLHASPALPADQTVLKELLGTDPGLWKRPVAKNEIPIDPKPISSGTGDQIAKNLAAPKPGEKPAVLLTFTPAAARSNPALSKELKEFLAKRGERKASAVPILLVIRQP